MADSQPSHLPPQMFAPPPSLPKLTTPSHINRRGNCSWNPTNLLTRTMEFESMGEGQRSAKRQKLASDNGFNPGSFFGEGLWESGFASEVYHSSFRCALRFQLEMMLST